MNKNENHKLFYNYSLEYLYEILPKDMKREDLEKYFVGDKKDFQCLEDIFEQLIKSAQNYQRMPNVIKFEQKRDFFKKLLFDFDFRKISESTFNDIYELFNENFEIKNSEKKNNCWYKWTKSIINSSKFINDFEDLDDFLKFISMFEYNLQTKIALPLLISKKISGIGFALACDFLKELGFTDYSKPDVHIVEVLTSLQFSEKDDIQIFEEIVRIASDCKEIDNTITPYKVDKIIWLICSGKFYLDDLTIKPHKQEYINFLKHKLN